MSRASILRVLFLCLCLLIVPALVVAQAGSPPDGEPLPPEMFNPDADRRVMPPLLLPGQMPAVEEAGGDAGEPAAPTAAAQGLWSRAVYYGFDGDDYELYVLSPESTESNMGARVLTSTKFVEAEPALSPEGRRVAFVSDREGDFDIYVAPFDPNGPLGQPIQLTHTSKEDYWPVWSPDGTRIAFYGFVGDQAEIYVMNADGGNLRRLTDHPAFDGYPTWSPDGTRIAFSSTRTGGYRIHVMNADGSGVTPLSGQSGSLYPIWSRDGARIIYSADPDLDGWLDLMMMNANGTGQAVLRDYPATTDGRCRGWSPAGDRAACTAVNYILYNNRWYINDTQFVSVAALGGADALWLGRGWHFDPSWASLDHEPPVAAVAALPAQSPGPFTVRWSAADAGLAGLRDVTIQVSVNNGAWTTWQTVGPETTQAEYPGVGGTIYAFRSQARDFAGNVEAWPAAPEAITTVENAPPRTWLGALPAHSRADTRLTVYWGGDDPGGSGIRGYQVQMKRGGGAWADWFANTLQTQAVLDAPALGIPAGETLRFRVRATDRAGNTEAWRSDAGDAATTLYTWRVSGRVTDHAGVPVGGAAVTATPATLGPVSSSVEGAYAAHLGGAAGTAAIQWAKAGYGALPLTSFGMTADAVLNVALPPADNALANGDFEAAGWGAWTAGGTLPAALSAEARLTGAKGALLGGGPLFGTPRRVADATQPWASQTQLVMVGGRLRFFWREGSKGLMVATRGADGAWSSPISLGVTSSYLLEQDSLDQAHLVIASTDRTIYRVLKADGSWSEPETVTHGSFPFNMDMALGLDGTVHVVWSTSNQVHYAWRTPGGIWAPARTVSDAYGGAQGRVAAAGNGRVHVAWVRDTSDRHMLTRQSAPGGPWSTPQVLITRDSITMGDMGHDAAGRVFLIWQQSGWNTDYSIKTAVHNGSSWRVETAVAEGVDSPLLRTVAADSSGGLHMVYERSGLVLYRQRGDGGWGAPQALPLSSTLAMVYLQMTFDPAGLPQLVSDTAGGGIRFTRQRAGGVWDTPLHLSPGMTGSVESRMVVDSAGQPHVAWLGWVSGDAAGTRHPYHAGPPLAAAAGEATLSQTVAIPAGMSHPALSFAYRAAALEVTVQPQSLAPDAAEALSPVAAEALPPSATAMRRHRIDLSAYAGRTVTVKFRLPQAAGAPVAWAWLDDVALGAARADLWVTGDSTAGLPGETTTHTLRVGNRGAAPADGATLTYTLPLELTFVSAVPAPASTSPLRWDLGALAAGGEPVVIRVTATVKASATPLRTVTSTAEAAAPGELELLNNEAGVKTILARMVNLPAILKN